MMVESSFNLTQVDGPIGVLEQQSRHFCLGQRPALSTEVRTCVAYDCKYAFNVVPVRRRRVAVAIGTCLNDSKTLSITVEENYDPETTSTSCCKGCPACPPVQGSTGKSESVAEHNYCGNQNTAHILNNISCCVDALFQKPVTK